jgi:hypothetical protein
MGEVAGTKNEVVSKVASSRSSAHIKLSKGANPSKMLIEIYRLGPRSAFLASR